MNIREQTYNFLWHTGHVWRRGDQWEQNKRGQRQAAKDKMDIVSYIQRSLHLKGCWEADKLMLSSIILNPNDVEQRRYIMLSIEFSLTKSKIVNVVLLYPSLAYYLTYSRYKIVFNHVWLFATPWTVAHQAPLSVGFFRQEYWSGLTFPFSRGSSQPVFPWDWAHVSCVSCIGRWILYCWTIREAPAWCQTHF